MKTLTAIVTTALMLLIGLAQSASASIITYKSFEDLAVQSELAAVGRVVRVESHPTVDQTYAYTYVTVGELEIMKGTYRLPTLTLRLDGGPLGDGTTLYIPGIPEFSPGEKVVLFVKGNGQQICPLVGWEQGLLRVVRDSQGQEVLKTSTGHQIRSIKQGKFQIDAAQDQHEAEATAGVADYGQSLDLNQQQSLKTEPALTLHSFKQQLRATVIQAGPKAQPRVEVKSASITLESPKPRTSESPKLDAVQF